MKWDLKFKIEENRKLEIEETLKKWATVKIAKDEMIATNKDWFHKNTGINLGDDFKRWFFLKYNDPGGAYLTLTKEKVREEMAEYVKMQDRKNKELLQGTETNIHRPNEETLTVASIAIMHSYWSEQDKTKGITKTSAKMWGKSYKCSPNTLLRSFNEFNDNDRRMTPANVENKRSVENHIQYFEDFLPLLQTLCPKAFEIAQKDLKTLKTRYQ